MGVAQYKVAEDHLFAALKGAQCSPTDLSAHTHVTFTVFHDAAKQRFVKSLKPHHLCRRRRGCPGKPQHNHSCLDWTSAGRPSR